MQHGACSNEGGGQQDGVEWRSHFGIIVCPCFLEPNLLLHPSLLEFDPYGNQWQWYNNNSYAPRGGEDDSEAEESEDNNLEPFAWNTRSNWTQLGSSCSSNCSCNCSPTCHSSCCSPSCCSQKTCCRSQGSWQNGRLWAWRQRTEVTGSQRFWKVPVWPGWTSFWKSQLQHEWNRICGWVWST